jgi:hypothetical protein
MKQYIYFTIIVFALLSLKACNRVDETTSDFENVAYLEVARANNSISIPLKAEDVEKVQDIQASLALPVENDTRITYKADLVLVSHYNTVNDVNYETLPEEFYELSATEAIIPAGEVRSSTIQVIFKNLGNVPSGFSFVLPVTLESAAGVSILNGSKTIYYILKKGAPIVVAANIKSTFLELVDPTISSSLANISQLTMEALICPHEWGPDAGISSVMGIEDYFLIRIGDSGYPVEQVQISKGSGYGGNWPSADNTKRLKKDVWQHIALTFDLVSRDIVFYVDGKIQSTGTASGTTSSVTFNRTTPVDRLFYIGKSYNDERSFRGEICEVRIWNVVRTAGEIAQSKYYVDPASLGLAAYWKFDEGLGNDVYDYSGNNNHLTVGVTGTSTINDIKWVPVEVGLED